MIFKIAPRFFARGPIARPYAVARRATVFPGDPAKAVSTPPSMGIILPTGPQDLRQRPIAGVVGRELSAFRWEVLDHADGAELEEVIECTALEGTVVNTNECLSRIRPSAGLAP